MKKLVFSLILVLVFSLTTTILAQNDGTAVTIAGNTAAVTTTLPDVVVSCPPSAVSVPVLRNAEFVFGFANTSDVLVVPNATISEDGVTLTVNATVLSCASTPAEVIMIDRSPSISVNDAIPRPENLEGLPEALTGYAVVNSHAANLRSCDDPTCTRVALVSGGDSLVVLGRNAAQSWWFVQVGDIRGWIWGDLIYLRGDLSDIPFVQTAGEVEPPVFYVGYGGNPLYTDLTASARIACRVQGNSFYPLVGRTARDTYFLVDATCTDGTVVRGWMEANTGLVRNSGRVPVPIYRGFHGEGGAVVLP
ncbi:MAG: hypothetical protein Q9P01_06575 [Anaerolineae bacterium]|nr:hypothetical protein [Anaerolineae bacterium]